MYYIQLCIIVAVFIYICMFLEIGQHKTKIVVGSLLFIIFIYEPAVDVFFIRKMKLYTGKGLWKKYPFWSFRKKLLFKDS